MSADLSVTRPFDLSERDCGGSGLALRGFANELLRSKPANGRYAFDAAQRSGAPLELAGLQQVLKVLDDLLLGNSVHQRDFSAEPVEGRRIQLPFAKALAGIAWSEQIARDFRNRDDI